MVHIYGQAGDADRVGSLVKGLIDSDVQNPRGKNECSPLRVHELSPQYKGTPETWVSFLLL